MGSRSEEGEGERQQKGFSDTPMGQRPGEFLRFAQTITSPDTVIPPPNCIQNCNNVVAKADSGASKHYFTQNDKIALTSIKNVLNGPQVSLPNGTTVQASESGMIPLHSSLSATAPLPRASSGRCWLSLGIGDSPAPSPWPLRSVPPTNDAIGTRNGVAAGAVLSLLGAAPGVAGENRPRPGRGALNTRESSPT